MSMATAVHPVDEILPAPKMFALGLQHVLVMYAGAIAVPLIVAGPGVHRAPERQALDGEGKLQRIAPHLANPTPVAGRLLACDQTLLAERDGNPGLGKKERGRDAGDPAADDDDIDLWWERPVGGDGIGYDARHGR